VFRMSTHAGSKFLSALGTRSVCDNFCVTAGILFDKLDGCAGIQIDGDSDSRKIGDALIRHP